MAKSGRIVIVGAGPTGVVCALALCKRGIPVTVFEQEHGPVKDQRAASIHPPTLAMLDEIGVTTRIIDKGIASSKYRYHDRLDGSVVAEFDLDRMRDEFKFPFVLQFEQCKMTAAIADEYADGADFDIRFGTIARRTRPGDTFEEPGRTPADGGLTGKSERLYAAGIALGKPERRRSYSLEFWSGT